MAAITVRERLFTVSDNNKDACIQEGLKLPRDRCSV